MKLQIYSDIHTEFYKNFPRITKYADTLVLAGDIGIFTKSNYTNFLQYVSQTWKDVIYVPGNHEYYNSTEPLTSIKSIYTTIFSAYDNIHYLDNRSIILDYGNEKIRFIGSTLWSNPDYTKGLCDFDQIKELKQNKLVSLSIETFKKMHEQSIEYIKQTLDDDKTIKTVLITHFPPVTHGTSHPKYKNSVYMNYFSNNLDTMGIPVSNICAWISGHTHFSHNFTLDCCRFMSNQMGYPGELNESGIEMTDKSVIDV